MLRKDLKFKNIVLQEKLSNKPKKSNVNFSVVGLLDNFSSKIKFLNSKKSFQSIGSELTFRLDLEVVDISYYTDLRQIRGAIKVPKTVLKLDSKPRNHVYFDFLKYLVVSNLKPLKERAFSVFLECALRIISET
jgi:hypothetical protein